MKKMHKIGKILRNATQELLDTSSSYPVTTILGPRQSGKTTLAKQAFPDKPYVSLEDPDVRSFVSNDPRQFLKQYPDGAIFDEVQRAPTLLSYIQTIVDKQEKQGMFILTGSHQLELQAEISQSLAGRTGILSLLPLSLQELQQAGIAKSLDEQMFHGFYPRIYKHNITPQRFYRDYVQTYVERDVKLLVNIKDLDQFQRFLSLCATRVGQTVDYTLLSNDLGISRHTIKDWISALKASFLITTLPPYFQNLGKRIVKSPKLYFNDVGLVCYLLGISTSEQLQNHPLRGNLFENLVINEVTKTLCNQGIQPKLYFYRDSNQLEVDLLFQHGPKLIAIEIKSSQTFHKQFLKNLSKFKTLAKDQAVTDFVIYSGEHEQKVNDTQVLNYNNLAAVLQK